MINEVISFVDDLVKKAVSLGASDIHLEPEKNKFRIRMRIDGILQNFDSLELERFAQISSRFKIIANLDISERRLPQDGKFSLKFSDRFIDFRISTFVLNHGEKLVVRILDKAKDHINLSQLGIESKMLEDIQSVLSKSNGFLIVCGPTGSGKTTTLYAALKYLNSIEKNIVTLEDPIEYEIDGINQSQINPEIGFTFSKAMRSVLRQDPDIIMVGEIRDAETAKTAVTASLTGHLVLSTLHTGDAVSSIMRLIDIEVEPFLIGASLSGIIAQRLARKLCVDCKYSTDFKDAEKKYIEKNLLEIKENFSSKGCQACNFTGYKGRIGIFQFLKISETMARLIASKAYLKDIMAQSTNDGAKSLLHDGVQKVNNGLVSLGELVKSIS